jgi:hypothetical protein
VFAILKRPGSQHAAVSQTFHRQDAKVANEFTAEYGEDAGIYNSNLRLAYFFSSALSAVNSFLCVLQVFGGGKVFRFRD